MISNIYKKKICYVLLFLFFSFIFLIWKMEFKTDKQDINILKYEKIITKINIDNPKKLQEIEHFISKNKNIYGTLVSMFLSKKYIINNDLDKAIIYLNNSLKYTKEENLKNILKLRIAKINIEKNENEKAIKTLKDIKNPCWENIIENIKGDILIKKHDIKNAIKSWEKSQSVEESNASKEIIKMKINEFKEKS